MTYAHPPSPTAATSSICCVVASGRSVGELVARLNLSQPGVSKHLRVLRETGLVAVRPAGRERRYALRAEPLADVDAWLEPV